MEAYKVLNPISSAKYPLNTYRVKKDFSLGMVTWPIGAMRLWTEKDRNSFQDGLVVFYNYSIDRAIEFMKEHFETVEFRYPEA